MKVKEVIEKLKRFDQEKEIRVDNNKKLWFRYNENYISIEIEEKEENELKLNELDVQKLNMKENEVLVVNVCIRHMIHEGMKATHLKEMIDIHLKDICKAFNEHNITTLVYPYTNKPLDLKVVDKKYTPELNISNRNWKIQDENNR